MKLKYYVLFSFAFMFFGGLYLYSLDTQDYTYTLPFSDLSLTLPIAVWIVGIVGLFFVATLICFVCMWVKDMLEEYRRKNDYDKLLSQINEQALNREIKNRVFKCKNFSELSKILQRFSLEPKLDSMQSFHRKIDNLFEAYKDVMSGKVVELKSYHLSHENKFNIQNLKNKISTNIKFAFQVLNEDYSEELKIYAVFEIFKNSDQKNIERLLQCIPKIPLNKEIAQGLFRNYLKYLKNIDRKDLFELFGKVGFEPREYIDFARESKGVLNPDEWISFFEEWADCNESVELAFFYVLFELEMIDKAKERHRTHIKGEYRILDAYFDLKDSGKNYPFDIFLLCF